MGNDNVIQIWLYLYHTIEVCAMQGLVVEFIHGIFLQPACLKSYNLLINVMKITEGLNFDCLSR